MDSLRVWLGMSLLPFMALITMVDVGVCIYKHKLIAVVIMLVYVSSLAYLIIGWDLNPLKEASFWACSCFMAFVLYLGWDVGKRQMQQQRDK